ncbi:MAG: hypothetical protein QOJ89_1252 [bacterium]
MISEAEREQRLGRERAPRERELPAEHVFPAVRAHGAEHTRGRRIVRAAMSSRLDSGLSDKDLLKPAPRQEES